MKTGRTIVLTGAAGGMGAEFVKRFLDNGDTVIVADSSDEALENLTAKLANARLLTRSADITREQDTEALAAFAKERSGHIDVLVNVAGFFPVQPFLEMTAGDWRKIIDINLTGTALVGNQEPPLGSHLVTPRRGYLHRGIYVGARKVVYYSGFAHGLRRGPVEEVPFAHFARGQCVGGAIRFRRSRGHLPSMIPCGGKPLSAVDQ
jgi:NAD(P)-dependent dehydrogenase (short-subunit alcohol dehydrogenase family)